MYTNTIIVLLTLSVIGLAIANYILRKLLDAYMEEENRLYQLINNLAAEKELLLKGAAPNLDDEWLDIWDEDL